MTHIEQTLLSEHSMLSWDPWHVNVSFLLSLQSEETKGSKAKKAKSAAGGKFKKLKWKILDL